MEAKKLAKKFERKYKRGLEMILKHEGRAAAEVVSDLPSTSLLVLHYSDASAP
jgi:hypothetical protein